MTTAARQEESAAAQGARWITIAMVVVGLLNYGYALLLTHMLTVAGYARFAGSQGLILWASTVATVSVPWVLAQAIVRARSDEERNAAVRFAKLASAGSGSIAAVLVGVIAVRFAGPLIAVVVAASTLVIFLGTTTIGWLQGRERMRILSGLYIADNLIKNTAGLLLVLAARFGAAGAIGAFGVGALVFLVRWPRTPFGSRRLWRSALGNGDLWRRAVVIGGGQGLVSLFVAVDVVLVAMLPGDRALAASYQASATLARVPFYIAGAVAMAFFPSLSRQASGGTIAARAVRMYAAAALPIAAVMATIPAPILAALFPRQYGAVAVLLKYTAVTGLAAGGISLITAFFQAADESAGMRWLFGGLAGYVLALLGGWRVAGIAGLAAGGALGSTTAFVLLITYLVRREGRGVLALVPVAEPLVVAAALILLRPQPLLWIAVAGVAGLRAAIRFTRPGARHARAPRWVASSRPAVGDRSAVAVLTEAVWQQAAPRASAAEVGQALELARLNRVAGRLARAYPEALADVLTEAGVADRAYTRLVDHSAICLLEAGIPALLLPGAPVDRDDPVVDLVVAEPDWPRGLAALSGLATYGRPGHFRSDGGRAGSTNSPPVRFHTDLSWLGVPIHPSRLLARARPAPHGLLILAAADQLRILLAEGLFYRLALDLHQLLALRRLLHPSVVAEARIEAEWEGWRMAFDQGLRTATEAIGRLDERLPVGLPVPMPALAAGAAGRPSATAATPDHRSTAGRRPSSITKSKEVVIS